MAKYCIWSLAYSKLFDIEEKWCGGEIKCTLDTSSAWGMDINQTDGISIPDAQDYRNM